MKPTENAIAFGQCKRDYDRGVAFMSVLSKALWQATEQKEKCRIVVEYDPDADRFGIYYQPNHERKLCSQEED